MRILTISRQVGPLTKLRILLLGRLQLLMQFVTSPAEDHFDLFAGVLIIFLLSRDVLFRGGIRDVTDVLRI